MCRWCCLRHFPRSGLHHSYCQQPFFPPQVFLKYFFSISQWSAYAWHQLIYWSNVKSGSGSEKFVAGQYRANKTRIKQNHVLLVQINAGIKLKSAAELASAASFGSELSCYWLYPVLSPLSQTWFSSPPIMFHIPWKTKFGSELILSFLFYLRLDFIQRMMFKILWNIKLGLAFMKINVWPHKSPFSSRQESVSSQICFWKHLNISTMSPSPIIVLFM